MSYKKLNFALVFSIILTGITFTACKKIAITGNGIPQTETRSVAAFTSINLDNDAIVNISKAAAFKVTVTDDSNILPYVSTRVSGNKLIIDYSGTGWVRRGNLVVNIEMPTLAGLEINGSGDLNVVGNFGAIPNFNANINGSGKINMDSAWVDNFNSHISGSGKIEALNVQAKNANCKISGSGSSKVSVINNLNANISGSGNIYYKGNPIISTNISGSGSVRKVI